MWSNMSIFKLSHAAALLQVHLSKSADIFFLLWKTRECHTTCPKNNNIYSTAKQNSRKRVRSDLVKMQLAEGCKEVGMVTGNHFSAPMISGKKPWREVPHWLQILAVIDFQRLIFSLVVQTTSVFRL